MVDPVTAALLVLHLPYYDQLKKGIGAYKSVAEVGQEMNLLFRGNRSVRRRNKSAGVDSFSTKCCPEIIDHKLARKAKGSGSDD